MRDFDKQMEMVLYHSDLVKKIQYVDHFVDASKMV